MTISLAFLATKLVRAAVEGRLPRGINIERLRDAPAEWRRQFASGLPDWIMASLGAQSQDEPGGGFARSPMDAYAQDR
jgi:hypothetical protein